jgi:hypothetical protein
MTDGNMTPGRLLRLSTGVASDLLLSRIKSDCQGIPQSQR